MSDDRRYIVICQSVIGGGSSPFEIAYSWDGQFFVTRGEAARHGWAVRDSDDFNVGVVDGRRLVSFDWMDEPVGETPEIIALIASKIGLRAAPPPSLTIGSDR